MDEPNKTQPGLAAVAGILPPDTQEQVKGDAQDLAATAKQTLAAVQDEAGEQLDNLKQEAAHQLADATGKAKTFAGQQKDVAGEQLGGVASAISRVADELDDQPVVAGYAHDLADGIKRVSDTVKTRNVDELMAMAEDFGRTQPLAFLGAAALAGFVASRFVLSSANRRRNEMPAGSSEPPNSQSPTDTSPAWSPAGQGGV